MGLVDVRSESESRSVVSDSLGPHGLYSPWNSPGQNPGVGSLSLLQGIFPTQELNRGLPHCRRILYQLSHKGSPKMSEVEFKRISLGFHNLKSFCHTVLLFSCEVVSDSFIIMDIVVRQAPLSMGFSRQEYWKGLPFLPPGDLLTHRWNPRLPHW